MGDKLFTINIIADNALIVNSLRRFLENKFPDEITVICSYDLKSCLRTITEANAVIIDYFIDGRSAQEITPQIRELNPHAEIIMHSSTDDVAASITALLKGERVDTTAKKFRHKFENQYN